MRAELEWYGPPKSNGIVLPWAATIRTGNKLAYVNPPYSSKAIWLRRCLEEARAGMEVIALVPADTDTAHWYLYCTTAATRRCFLRTRLVHTGVKSEPEPARFPSVLVYWQPERDNQRIRRFHDVFTPEGWVV